MPNIYEIAAAHRAQLAARDAQIARDLLRRYAEAWRAIAERIEDVAERMRTDGVTPARVFQDQRLRALQALVQAEIARFAAYADTAITTGQQATIEQAERNVEELLRSLVGIPGAGIGGGFEPVSTRQASVFAGFLADGSPLADLLNELPGDAGQRVAQAIFDGLTLGENPNRVARRARGYLAGNLVRSITIARTEMLRVYRTVLHENYQAAEDVLDGWEWLSALGTSTCPVCWAMHGTRHPLTERLDDHPRGRCVPIPVTKTWQELGQDSADVEETRTELEPGPALFAQLSEERQRAVLGPRKYEAYRQGLIQLADLVRRTADPRWGSMRTEGSLQYALQRAERRRRRRGPT